MHCLDKTRQLLSQRGGPERAARQMSPLGRGRAAQGPRGPQITPTESRLVSQRKPESPVTSSSAPAIEASAPQEATADVLTPMETGGAGDGCSWAEQTKDEDDFRRCRPVKHPRSQSRR